MSEDSKIKPPYVSYATFKNFLASVKDLVPARIDPTHPFMVGQSGSAQSFLMSALRFFSLIEGKTPTPDLKRLAQSEGEDRKKIWREIFEKAFHPIMRDLDLTTATAGMLHEKFREQDLNGETVNKCFSFFVAGAQDAGIPLAKHLEPGSRNGGNGPRKARKPRAANTPTPAVVTLASSQGQTAPRSMSEMLLEKFPAFDPGWSEELKTKWFEGYEKLLNSSTQAPQ